jgi:serine/threonine protein kinase
LASAELGPAGLTVCRFGVGERNPRSMTTVAKAGRYEIVGELGRGAMGVVYKAVDPVIGRTVAVKTIRLSEEGTGLSRSELLSRFQTEARAAGLLTHPNIVVVYDAGEEDGLYYITMELVEGKSLQNLLDARQAFPLPRTLRIMEQTCSALQFAHERNVIHRDIKPANLMLTPDDTVKITDFGTAKILQFGTVQQTAHVMGTPSYMSPEQVKGRAVDGRSDIFSLGVMLYEMVTGEKPFPGQNITTVIYKIVNEDPVPPRQIDPSIHTGISAIVMRALEKEPDNRYQSCREMLEDLRNYRALSATGPNPHATVIMGAGQSPAATLPLGVGSTGRGAPIEEAAMSATARSLSARAATPGQTPVIRRTGAIAPIPEPPKKGWTSTIILSLILVGVIIYGAYKLRPVWEETRKLNAARSGADVQAAPDANPPSTAPSSPSANTDELSLPAKDSAGPATPEPKPAVETVPVRPTPKRLDVVNGAAKAAEFKGRIEQAISDRGLNGRVKVIGSGNTLTLAGKLKPGEHSDLLKFLRDAPSEVRVVDHIEYDDTADPAASGPRDGGHPIPSADLGAIHVVTDVLGATAILHGPAGRVLNRCETPCSFNNLRPQQYGLEVRKDGYQPVQTALQIKAGDVQDQKVTLESLTHGLQVTTNPPGADVFINGAKQGGQTPLTLPLGPGQYNLVIRLNGYEGYSETVKVTDNAQTRVNVELTQRGANGHVAWAQVSTDPPGAEILVDGTSTGQVSPGRVQISSGTHTIILRLNGYQQIRRMFQASEGGTITLDESLKPKP